MKLGRDGKKIPELPKQVAEIPSALSICVIEILEIMTCPLPFAMLRPLGSDLTSLLLTMKDNNVEEEAEGILSKVITEEIDKTCNKRGTQKKQRFMAVMKAVCKTPPTEMGKKIATIEKITKVNKIVETI